MNKKIFWIGLSLFMLIVPYETKAWEEPLRVGRPCPDFILTDLHNSPLKELSLKDLRGKWLVLDFWSEYCAGCIASLPKMNDIQQKFKDDLQLILIGIPHKDVKTIKSMYSRIEKKHNLNLSVAFDKTLYDSYKGVGVPYIIVVDPSGTVRAKTTYMSEEIVKGFLMGKQENFNTYDWESPVISSIKELSQIMDVSVNEPTGYLSKTTLKKWNWDTPQYTMRTDSGMFAALGYDLKSLYKIAYTGKLDWFYRDTNHYGKYYPEPLLELRDSSLFVRDTLYDRGYLHQYSYAYFKPGSPSPSDLSDNENIRQRMQLDLDDAFGFQSAIEVRMMPCLRLKATSDSTKVKLKSARDKKDFQFLNGYRQGFRANKMPMDKFIGLLPHVVNDFPKNLQIVDDTGILTEIDITVNAIYFDELREALLGNGLSLEPSEQEMKVIIIRDQYTIGQIKR